jgi:hypothetical protein
MAKSDNSIGRRDNRTKLRGMAPKNAIRQVGVVKSTEAVVRTSTSAFWADIDVKHVECHLTLASLK